MSNNRHRLSRFVTARTPAMRAVRAWRNLLPDWKPDLDQLQALDRMPIEHRQAVRVLAHGWGHNDGRWDVLLALLEWERRAERERRNAADELSWMASHECRYCGTEHDNSDCDSYSNVVSMDQEYERLRHEAEITVETPWEPSAHATVEDGELTLIPKPGTPRVFTVRTLRSIREEQLRGE